MPADAGIFKQVTLAQVKNLIMTPAATAEPITPATLGPMACMSRKFWGLASRPSLLDTRAAIGTAETPADPMSGLILSLLKRFISFAINTPPARSEEHSLNSSHVKISYAVFCLKKKNR